jgi:ATP-binding cassette subfamily B protein
MTAPDAIAGRRRRPAQKLAAFRRVVRRLSPYLRGRTRDIAFAVLTTLGYMLLRLAEPWPIKLVLDNVLLHKRLPHALSFVSAWTDTPGGLLNLLVVSIVVVAVLSGFFYYWQNVLSAYIGQKVVSRLRVDLFRHLQHLDFSFHDRRKTGDLLVRLVADIRLLRDALVKVPLDFSENSLLMFGMAVIMLLMDWKLTLLSFAAIPVLFLLMHRYRKPMRAAIRKQRRQEGDLASAISESLGAIRVVHGFGLEEQEVQRVGAYDNKSLREGLTAARIEARLRWASELAVGLITAIVVGVAARRVLSGALSPGDLVVFISYLRTFARPLRRASRTTEQVTRTMTAGERILEVFDFVPGVRDLPNAKHAPPFAGEVTFENVGLRHGRGPWVLRSVNLVVRPGERLGIVGPTGAGKSSLVSLVPRFYDATEGRVSIDGSDVRTFTLASLRRQIAFVFQEPVLFSTTIADNISAGRPGANREEIEEAARNAGIHAVIASLSEGYETIPGERGGTLSGGQRQCVAIARAMLRDAPIVVLDEPTTGLDQRSAGIVTEALQKLMQGRTVLMISHDLDRLRDADRIVVLENAHLVQEGEYSEMALREGLFRELVEYGQVR